MVSNNQQLLEVISHLVGIPLLYLLLLFLGATNPWTTFLFIIFVVSVVYHCTPYNSKLRIVFQHIDHVVITIGIMVWAHQFGYDNYFWYGGGILLAGLKLFGAKSRMLETTILLVLLYLWLLPFFASLSATVLLTYLASCLAFASGGFFFARNNTYDHSIWHAFSIAGCFLQVLCLHLFLHCGQCP